MVVRRAGTEGGGTGVAERGRVNGRGRKRERNVKLKWQQILLWQTANHQRQKENATRTID